MAGWLECCGPGAPADSLADGDRLAFMADDGRLLMLEQSRLRVIDPPRVLFPAKFALLGDNDIVVVDHAMRIHISVDNGRTWTVHETASSLPPTPRFRIENTNGRLSTSAVTATASGRSAGNRAPGAAGTSSSPVTAGGN